MRGVRNCGAGLGREGGAVSESPAALLRQAATRMRGHHGPGHPRHEFWSELASWLETRAAEYDEYARGPYGPEGGLFVAGEYGRDADPAIAIARAYLGGSNG